MPRTDVPPPGQGKRSKRKAWRDNSDQAIAIYGLTAAEETLATEEEMSQVLPFWDDDVPQPQSQSPQQTYTKEEAQELVEMAYQEGWQQGMEEGYKLGKDKGYKEYKEVQEEEEAKKAAATYKDNQDTPCTRGHKDQKKRPGVVFFLRPILVD
jgi:flagellar biosynthesis/type III secretory pathway protein FliH